LRTLTGFIPFAVLLLLTRQLHRRWDSWRESILSAAIVWGVAITIITEGLSLFGLLSFAWVLAAWLAFAVVIATYWVPARPIRHDTPFAAPVVGRWWSVLAGLAVIVSAVGVTAVAAPPNTTDSLVYHMPRVVHWIQNGSVAHYPTHVLRQLHLGPWAEFAILQPQVLSGGDRFANLIQWLAMLGSLVGVSLIVRQLGGHVRGQILAAVVCATIPMGILQASGTQNDYVVSFWLVCFVYYGCVFTRPEGGGGAGAAWLMGASLGLAVLTKATAYIVALPFLAWILFSARTGPLRRGKAIAIIALAVLALNAGPYWRNLRIYGSPLGPGREGPFVYASEAFSPASLVSNAVRNIALHLGTPNARVNAMLERGVGWLHDQVGAEVNDPKTTWLGTAFRVAPPRLHEDFAGNPAHVGLIAVSCTMLMLVPTLRRRLGLLAYSSALVAAFLIFAMYLKWQPWHSRLHLPLFVLWCPVIAVIWERYRRVCGILAVFLLLLSVPWVVYNKSRPLLGPHTAIARSRVDQYFVNRMDLREPYAAAMQKVQEVGCSRLGLWVDDVPEYPLWVLAGQKESATRIEHTYVYNESASSFSVAAASFDPCAMLLIMAHPSIPATLPFRGSVYTLRLRVPPVSLFLRD
jgi:Dolichyl-phosphate-mannose-protein mannosyltransferase